MVIPDHNEEVAMANRTLSVAEAKANLSDAIRDVEMGSSVVITRHGKPVAALVRVDELAALERLRAAGPSRGLASLAGGWPGSEEFVKHVNAARRHGRRKTPPLG
jgi:prevent-host-death family protein